jgi:hypothetical protein
MEAYFDIIRQLGFFFLGITLFAIPIFAIYAKYDGLNDDPMHMITQFSLGNMGGSSASCSQVP